MNDFTFHNPVRIIFGKGSISSLAKELPTDATILMISGSGSIKRNGVYGQVMAVAKERIAAEFTGIEPNPLYETCMSAVEKARSIGADFLLAVGGGSVLDATKFIAAALKFTDGDPWKILSEGAKVESALPIGAVLTLPATGSEMNGNSVISRAGTQEKLAFGSPCVLPVFSILDPEVTYTLPERQVANGIVDAFVHVMEHERERKREKLLQYGERVWGIRDGDEQSRIDEAIARTDEFFRSTGCKTRLSDYGIPESICHVVAERLESRGGEPLGEHSAITPAVVKEILKLRV